MKQNRKKDFFLEQIRKIPIIQVACEKVKIARSTVYRWREEDKEFREKLEEALSEGEAIINDIGEAQLISLIKDQNWHAISFWLRSRNPKFKDKVEISGDIKTRHELSPEQQAVIQKALNFISPSPIEGAVTPVSFSKEDEK